MGLPESGIIAQLGGSSLREIQGTRGVKNEGRYGRHRSRVLVGMRSRHRGTPGPQDAQRTTCWLCMTQSPRTDGKPNTTWASWPIGAVTPRAQVFSTGCRKRRARRDRTTRWGDVLIIIDDRIHMTIYTLASLQCRDGTRRVFTNQAGIASTKQSEKPRGVPRVA